MVMKTRLLWSLLVLVLGGGVLLAAGRERRVTPPHPRGDAIGDFATHIRIGPPRHYQNLTLFPVLVSEVSVPDVDLTLDKAMALDLLDISELDSADVNRVHVRNRAKRPVFIMAGEMLRGAKQDRIAGDDIVIAAGDEVTIPVFCVEHGRWTGKSESFKSGGIVAAPPVRLSARRGQSAVWDQVAQEQDRLRAPSTTGTLSSIHESAKVQGDVKPYTRALSDLPDTSPTACGVVATAGGVIIAADLFSSRALFEQLYPKLLESYVTDALDRRPREREYNPVQLQRWLNGLRQVPRTPKDTPGEGVIYELRGGDILGSALVWQAGVVHMELFKAVFLTQTQPEFNGLKFRRERLEQRTPTPER
jgi:hypothetical protein